MFKQPLRCARLAIDASIPLQPTLQCQNCLQFMKQRFRCPKCKDAYFCCQQCMEAQWPTHSKICGQKLSIMDELKERVKLKSIGFDPNLVYAFVQVVASSVVVVPIPFDQYNQSEHFGRFLAHLQRPIKFGQPLSLMLVDNHETIHFKATSDVIEVSDLTKSANQLFMGMRLICKDCKGPSELNQDTNEAVCLKCKSVYKADENQLQMAIKISELSKTAEYLLLFPTPPPVASQIEKALRPAHAVIRGDEFVQLLTKILKANVIHHLSLATYAPISYALTVVQQAPKAVFYKAVTNLLEPVDVYSLCFCFVKLSVQHYGMFTSVAFNNLKTVCEVLNFYTLNELESCSFPPLMQAADDEKEVLIQPEERQRMADVASRLLVGHKNCLDFCSQLKELTDQTGDEVLMGSIDKLAGQVECRVENLESWTPDYGTAEDEMVVRGKEYIAERQQHTGDVDILK